jgi:glycerate 2-kinase
LLFCSGRVIFQHCFSKPFVLIKILIAPDKFKGSLTTFEVCNAIEEGLLQASSSFRIVKCPMADGGDGLSEVISYYTGAIKQWAYVQDPLGRTIKCEWLLSADGTTAVIEMAKASGLQLLKREERNPVLASTYGTGQLIKAAVESGAGKIILGIGGSATNDCGIGMAAALGYRFLDSHGKAVLPMGGNLLKIAAIDCSGATDMQAFRVQVACDVKNLLLGEAGASHTYGPQKGANPAMVKMLEEGMRHFAAVIKKDTGIDVTELEGGGAAGGMGAGSVAFLQAELVSGIDLVMQYANFEEHLQRADYVFTGEGKIDEQTLKGKVVMGVASLAKRHSKVVIAVCGSQAIAATETASAGIDAVFPVLKYPMRWEEAKMKAYPFLKDTALNVGNLIQHCSSGR